MFAAVLRMRKWADAPIATVNEPNDVTPVFTAIVIIPVAVLMTKKSYAMFVAAHVANVSKVVPSGIVMVYVVPVALII